MPSDAGVTGQSDFTIWGLPVGVCLQFFCGLLALRVGCQSTNTVRRSLPRFLFLLRDLLRSAPLLRSYCIRLSGICASSENRLLSEPERVPPLSMNAIKLSKPLIETSPSNYLLKTRNLSFCISGLIGIVKITFGYSNVFFDNPLCRVFIIQNIIMQSGINRGRLTVETIYPEKSFFKPIFFRPDTPLFSRHASRPQGRIPSDSPF